jgi:hypothetical protein
MNRRSILTKTGKGLMEATGKTNDLSRILRNILKEIDGKVSVSELMEKFEKIPEPKLLEVLAEMERDGYVREFVGKQDGASARTPVGGISSPQSPTDADDLDFTAFTPAKPSAKASEEARLQAQAQEIARQAQATRAREEAAAKTKAEMAARAKAEAELKAKQAVAAKPAVAAPPIMPILGAGADAQARAQADALARARREAEERQRKDSEEKARKDAEVLAKVEADLALKREADARALREIQERTRREEEEKARREAEARAKLEAELRAKREAEERLRREMEERARREIEERMRREEAERLRREEEERARREVERKARVEAEARAKVDAELRARREAEERERREDEEHRQAQIRKREEEKERERSEAETAEALERAVQEEQEKAQREAEDRAAREEEERREREGREQEEEEQRRIEEKKRAKAEVRRAREEERAQAKETARLRKAERARERAGEEAWRGDEEALRDSGEGLSAAAVWQKRRPGNFAKTFAVMLLLLLIVGIAVRPFVPLEAAAYEKAAQAWLDQPVKIGSVNLTLLPSPRLKFEKVVIGKDPQVKVGVIRASPEITSLLEEPASLKTLELENATLPKEALVVLLQDRRGRRSLGVQRITAKGLKIDAPELDLPPLDLEASLSADGALKSVSLSGSGGLSVTLEPRGERAAIEISAAVFPLPVGVDLGFSEFTGKGTVSRSELVLNAAEARAFGGRVLGSARLRWGSDWSLDGELTARQMDAARIAGPLLASGTLAGKVQYSMRGLLPERMVLNRQFEGSFTIQKGVINNVDMTRVLQGSGSGVGTTPVTEMSGNVSANSDRLLVRQIRLAAGLLSATGQLDMDLDKNLSGRMQIDLRAQSVQARATLAVSGTLTNPQFRRSN